MNDFLQQLIKTIEQLKKEILDLEKEENRLLFTADDKKDE